VVGTRAPSPEGIKRTIKLVSALVKDGYTIMSGLAKGIDTVAHTTAIEQNGNTIAVIGTPINECYPMENKKLQDKIAKEHLLISQVPFLKYQKQDFRQNRYFFPERNKLMSALSKATIIVEAGETSGTLIQAKAAFKQGRHVFILDSCFKNPALSWLAKLEVHVALRNTDIGKCFYWRKFFIKKEGVEKNYASSDTNQLITNFKIAPTVENKKRIYYKNQAILQIAEELSSILIKPTQSSDFLKNTVFVPIPPSKSKSDPAYDDRNVSVLKSIKNNYPDLRIEEWIIQKTSVEADHTTTSRKDVSTLIENYALNIHSAAEAPKLIIIFDDVITAGRHFKAAQHLLARQFSTSTIYGLFVARSIDPDDS
jgi:DNA protecting protein DprA